LDEERRLLAALPQLSLRDQCLITFALNTGFRAAELAAITIRHVWTGEAVRPTVCLERHRLKNGRGLNSRIVRSRVVPLNPSLTVAIERATEIIASLP
jgi:integrase